MTTIEAFAKTCKFELPDRVVTYDLVKNNQLLKEYGGIDKDIIVRNAKMMKAIGLDSTRTLLNPEHFYAKRKLDIWVELFGVDPSGWEVVVDDGTAWFTKRPFANVKELEKYLPKKPNKEQVKAWYKERFKRVREVFHENDLVWVSCVEGPLTDAHSYTDFGLFFDTMMEAPEIVDYLMDVFTEYQLACSEAHAEDPSSPVFFICDDIAGSNGIMFSPTWLSEKLFPRLKTIYQPAREAGLKCCYHSDGNLDRVLDILVKDVKIDGLNPIEPFAGMDIRKVRANYPNLMLFGNVCVVSALTRGKVQDVEREVKGLLKDIAPSGGLFLGSSTEVDDSMPVENILAMYRTAKEWGKYPIDVKEA
ncbi:MAG: uroporphyrinogen decarboxylase family protein [Dehalobacterium sp.]